MPTITEFDEDFRAEMMDKAGTGSTFTQTVVERFRKKAVRHLYKENLATEVTNYTTSYTDMPLVGYTTCDYAMPTGWQRITGIEYWENTTNTFPVAKSALWDDRVRAGYVRIFDAPDYANYRLHLMGYKPYTDVDDPLMNDATYDVCLLAAQLFAARALASKRAANRKTASSADVALGAEVMWVRQLKSDYKEAVKLARKALRSPR